MSTFNECEKFKELFDELTAEQSMLSAEQKSTLREHEHACKPCRTWKAQMDSMVQMSHAMPQFDVSEALTQKIISAVEQESKTVPVEVGLLLPLSVVAGVVLLGSQMDSIDGLCSWAIGLVAVVVLKAVIARTPVTKEIMG